MPDTKSYTQPVPESDDEGIMLPHGCEVETKIDVLLENGASLPAGSLGRVVGVDTNTLRVRVVGHGEFTLGRDQVTPRTIGHARYAERRAEAETSLSSCTILRATVGSRAWGLAQEDSDYDTRAVFLWPFSWTSALHSVPDVIVSADGSHTTWEFGRTIEQALRADPNTLEMLFVPQIETLDPLGEIFIQSRDLFVSQAIYGSFGRYALAQSKKLRKSLRLAAHREKILDWLDCNAPATLETIASRLTQETVYGDEELSQTQAKEYIKQLYRSMFDQGILQSASFDGLAQFAKSQPAGLELPRDLRPKNAYNLLRIVSCAISWLRTGEPIIETTGGLRDRLLAIKLGEVPLEQSLAWTSEASSELEKARENSVLPAHPNREGAEALALRGRELAAQRWINQTPDAWGCDAPKPPKYNR